MANSTVLLCVLALLMIYPCFQSSCLYSGFCRSLFLSWHVIPWPFLLIKHTEYVPPLHKIFWWFFTAYRLKSKEDLLQTSSFYFPTLTPTTLLTTHSIQLQSQLFQYGIHFYISVELLHTLLLLLKLFSLLRICPPNSFFKLQLNVSSGDQQLWTSPNDAQVLAPLLNCATQSKLKLLIYIVHNWYLINGGYSNSDRVSHPFSVFL